MEKNPTYEELAQRVNELEQETERRKQAEAALWQSKHQVKQYLAIAGVIFVALDDEGNITLINECGLETLGYRREELLGKNWFETCLPHRFQKDVLDVYHQLMKGEIEPVEYFENPILRKDGEECIIAWHNTILQDPEGKTVGVLSSGEDITERKRMEQALTESEAKYRTILETIQDSYLEVDLEGNFQFFNNAFCELLGCPEDELRGRNNREFMDKTNTEKVLSIFSNVYETKKPVSGASWEYISKNGTSRYIEASVSLILDARGERIGFRGLGRDVTDQKKIEATLALNEARFRDISMSMADWIWEVDKDGKYIFSAGHLKDVLGYEPDEILGKTPFDFMPESEVAKVKGLFGEAVAQKKPIVDLKNWNLRKDGSRVCLLTSGVPIISDTGELLGYRGVDKDITSDLLIEKKLKQSLKTTEKIIANLPIGVVIVGKNKIIQRINKAALAMMGYESEKQIIGDICHTNICPAERGLCPIMDLGQFMDQSEKVVLHKEGRHIPVFKTALSLEIDGQTVVLEAFMDISALKTAEKALRANEERLHTVMETIADPVVVYDNQGRATYLNPAFTRVFGWHSEELINRKIDFVPDESVAETRDAITKVLKGERLTGFETQRYTKAGCTIDARLGAALLRDDTGQSQGIVVNFHDITREKQAEDELKEVNQELEQAIERANAMAVEAEMANIAKSEFLANMSHEIRTPMNGVIGMTGLLLDTDLTDEQKKYAGVVRASGESLLSLINDILDFSKIEAGKLELEVLDFDLRITLEDMAEVLALNAHKKGLELTALVDPEVPSFLRGDPGRLRQVIVNLAGNAVKFTHAGEVTIRADLEKEGDHDVMVRFAVTDTGIGIPSELLDALFVPFTQVDGSTTRKYGGTGLGLSISKQLAEMMGGEIGVENREGAGATFWFTARFEKQAKGTPVSVAPAADIRNVRVLVVDDHETNRLLVSTLLHSWGCRCEEAVDGAAALIKLNEGTQNGDPFRVALLDMQMPEMDGEELGRRIKADPQMRETVLIMMTSLGQRGDAKRLEKTGFSAYLPKPIRQAHLHDCLALALGLKPGDKAKAAGTSIITRHTLSEAKKRRMRILLAEDNATNQDVALAILKKLGYRADGVANGKEALEALRTLPYDLVLMDCQMPEMDGYEATRKIRQGRGGVKNPEVPVIAMTAHAMKGDREKCLKAGMNDYMAKPVDPQIIAQTLERWLQDDAGEIPAAKGKRETGNSGPGARDAQDVANASPVFDKAAFMERLMDDEDLARIVIAGFIEDIPKQIKMLKGYLDAGDTKSVERQVHTIKGASANVGGEALREVAFKMEKAGKAGDLDTIKADISELESQFERLKKAMEKKL